MPSAIDSGYALACSTNSQTYGSSSVTASRGPFRRKNLDDNTPAPRIHFHMIRKLKSGEYRLYSRKKSDATGKRRNLGTFSTLDKAKQHEREVQYFKKH